MKQIRNLLPLGELIVRETRTLTKKAFDLKPQSFLDKHGLRKLFGPQGGNTHPMLTSDPPKNKEKKTSCEDLQKKRFLLRTESQPNELRELFHPGYSRCLLSGISVLPQPSARCLSPFPTLRIHVSLFSHCYLFIREQGDGGENRSLKFLSLQTRGATSGPDRDSTVMKFTPSQLR